MNDNPKNQLEQKLSRSAVRNNPALQDQIITPNDQDPFAKNRKIIRSPTRSNINAQRKDEESVIDTEKFNKIVAKNIEEVDQETSIEPTNTEKSNGTIKKVISKLNKAHLTINIPTTPNNQEIAENFKEEQKAPPVAPVTPVTPLTAIRKSQNWTFDNSLKQDISLIDIEGFNEQPSLIGNLNNVQSKFDFNFNLDSIINNSMVGGGLTNQQQQQQQQQAPQQLRLSLKYVANLIPEFDGKCMSVNEYVEKLKHAKNMLSETVQANLIPILKMKLKGDVYRAMLNAQINNIQDFIKGVRQIYPSTDKMATLYGKIAEILQNPDETVLSFANRLQELVLQVKDSKEVAAYTEEEKRNFETKIDAETLLAFVEGLRQEIRLELGTTRNLSDAIQKAIEVETRLNRRDLIFGKANKVFCSLSNQAALSGDTSVAIYSCQICQDYGHEALFCHKVACVYCKNKDHLSDSCRIVKKKIQLICKFCNNHGHSIDACKMNRIKGNHCQYCQVMGHNVTQCPFIIEYELCWKCKESGHDPNNCKNQGKQSEMCEFCNGTTHTIKDCPDVTCKRCNQRGHVLKYCPILIDKKFLMCAICNKNGHEAEQCEEAKILVAQNRAKACQQEIQCQICNEKGHSGKYCPKLMAQQQATNNFNASYKNQNYNNYNNNYRKSNNFNNQNKNTNNPNWKQISCEYCKMRGHPIQECRKLKNLENMPKERKNCSYCKEDGHAVENCQEIKALESRANKFCSYCKNTNHMTEECFKLQNQQMNRVGNE